MIDWTGTVTALSHTIQQRYDRLNWYSYCTVTHHSAAVWYRHCPTPFSSGMIQTELVQLLHCHTPFSSGMIQTELVQLLHCPTPFSSGMIDWTGTVTALSQTILQRYKGLHWYSYCTVPHHSAAVWKTELVQLLHCPTPFSSGTIDWTGTVTALPHTIPQEWSRKYYAAMEEWRTRLFVLCQLKENHPDRARQVKAEYEAVSTSCGMRRSTDHAVTAAWKLMRPYNIHLSRVTFRAAASHIMSAQC